MRVLILGNTGMLGSTVSKWLARNPNLEVISTQRVSRNTDGYFDVLDPSSLTRLMSESSYDYVVNCVGVIKPNIDERDTQSISNAILINSLFPRTIARIGLEREFRVIQIATDCVYSGRHSESHNEDSIHDPLDVYGKTKSLGEVNESNVLNLRTSIVGPEVNSQYSLLEWFLHQPKNSKINGFINHFWNGVTTLHFARCVEALILNGGFQAGTFHLVPKDTVTKFELINLFAEYFGRNDLIAVPTEASITINRVLSTKFISYNEKIWKDAGYPDVPSVRQMVEELKKWINH